MEKNQRSNLIRKFTSDARGGVAIMVGIALTAILIGFLSITIDLGRTQNSKNKTQDATDAAALGVAEFILKGIVDRIGTRPDPYNWQPSQAEMNKYAEDLIIQNLSRDNSNAIYDGTSLSVNYEKSARGDTRVDGRIQHKVRVYACADVKTPLSSAAKHADATRTCTISEAAFAMSELSNLEVAFALDYTNSMYWSGENSPGRGTEPRCDPGVPNPATKCPAFVSTKAAKLVDAMNFVFDTYFPSAPESTVFASIIPYSGIVNLYPYNKTMVTEVTTQPPLPTTPYNLTDYRNYQGDSYLSFTELSKFYADYSMRDYARLNRIPVISDSAKLNNIVSGSGDPAGILPFSSYVKHYNDLNGQVSEFVRTSYCYNGAQLAVLDQRIERLEGAPKGIVQTDANGAVAGTRKEYPAGSGKYLSSFNISPTNVKKEYELHESFPVQPLSNNVSLLKKVVNRFTDNTQFYADNIGGPVTATNLVDRQSNRLNKAHSFSYTMGTSSFHGLMWAWFTINNKWQGRWTEASLHESFYSEGSASRTSRNALPTDRHIKHIIMMTDGHDNDGNDTSDPARTQTSCDAYTPLGAISDSQYVELCSAIKQDNVKIHILLLDFDQGTTSRYRECASDSTTFHNNVQPNQIKTIMDNIFKTIISDLATVQLVK